MDMRESFYEAVYDLSASNEGQEVCKPCDMTILQLDHQRDLTEWLHGHVYETLIKGYVREQVSPDFDFEQVEEMVAKVANSVERYGAKHQADAGQEGEAGWSITGLYQTIAGRLPWIALGGLDGFSLPLCLSFSFSHTRTPVNT